MGVGNSAERIIELALRSARVGARLYGVNALDVTLTQQARHDQLVRAQSQPERAEAVARLWRTHRQMADLNVRARFPDASPELHRWLVTELIYDTETATRFLGPRPGR